MGMGCYVSTGDGEIVYEHSNSLGRAPSNSCNVAEYLALESLLSWLYDNVHEFCLVTIYGDSQLVIMQMNNKWSIKDGYYVRYAHKCKKLLLTLKSRCNIKLEWIPREQNEYCDMLSKRNLSDLFPT